MSVGTRFAAVLNRADALAESPAPDPTADLEEAIRLYESVLVKLPPRASKELRASIENNLANVFTDRTLGDRASNLERAIQGYERACGLVDRERDRSTWARYAANLAGAFIARLAGDPAENLEKAIGLLEEASGALTTESPAAWAQVMNNLGSAYMARFAGDRRDNLEAALDCFSRALAAKGRGTAPVERASTLENLAMVYLARIVGDRTENLQRALEHASRAATLLSRHRLATRRAGAVVLKGAALFLLRDQQEGNLAKAIRAFRHALRVLSREGHPLRWAETQVDLAIALENRALADGDRSLREALRAFERALTVYRRDAMPRKFAFVQRALGDLWFRRERWHDSLAAYSEALSADRGSLAAAAHLASRQDFLRENRLALPRSAYCLARLGRAADSTLLLESARTRNLVELLGGDRLDAAPSEVRGPEELRDLAERLRCPLVYVVATSAGCCAVLTLPGAGRSDAHDVVRLDRFDLQRLHDQVYRLFYNVAILAGNDRTLRSILDQTWDSWRDDLAVPLARRLAEHGHPRAVLVPTGLLSLLPLTSAALGEASFSIAPSARVLRCVLERSPGSHGSAPVLCGLADPASAAPRLTFSRMELREIGRMFEPENRRLLVGEKARSGELRSAVAGATYLHLACHARFQSRDLARSTLLLAGDEALEVRELWQGAWDLSRCRLAVLSACSSGIVESRDQPEESFGLPSALLLSGVPAVLSSLWPVADASTALLLIRFYREHLVGGKCPAESLAAAQTWLRSATVADLGLESIYDEIYRGSPGLGERAHAFRKLRYYRDRPELLPFAHPFYWAGFFVSGLGFDAIDETSAPTSARADALA